MTLTVVVGSSGSGKTTFLNDVHAAHNCTYIRQYHNIRPYIVVTKIPNFDPTALPYWNIYQREGKADTIQVGGTMGGRFTAGLSGGQRKLLLFELICQRTKLQENLLLCLDEPFAGVTDDFVPFIVERLNVLREKHNIVVVTNDHIDTLRNMADNTLTVSAFDRTTVKINDLGNIDRRKAILALSVGETFAYENSTADLQFFYQVEIIASAGLKGVAVAAIGSYVVFLVCFWNSQPTSSVPVLIAGDLISFYALFPYLFSLVDWRDNMCLEADALLHSSKSMNKLLKTIMTVSVILIISLVQFGCTNIIMDGLESFTFWVAIFFDSASLTFPFIFLGLFSQLPAEPVGFLSNLQFLLMIFFSTTFSPGSGVNGIKEFRYLFPRFYFWCMIPEMEPDMEGCPSSDTENLLYLILSSMVGLAIFLTFVLMNKVLKGYRASKEVVAINSLKDDEFLDLQKQLYGSRAGVNKLDE